MKFVHISMPLLAFNYLPMSCCSLQWRSNYLLIYLWMILIYLIPSVNLSVGDIVLVYFEHPSNIVKYLFCFHGLKSQQLWACLKHCEMGSSINGLHVTLTDFSASMGKWSHDRWTNRHASHSLLTAITAD